MHNKNEYAFNNKPFMGSHKKRTLFVSECHSTKEIKQHSYFKDENEVLPEHKNFKSEVFFHKLMVATLFT
jgi:hypothetical protein